MPLYGLPCPSHVSFCQARRTRDPSRRTIDSRHAWFRGPIASRTAVERPSSAGTVWWSPRVTPWPKNAKRKPRRQKVSSLMECSRSWAMGGTTVSVTVLMQFAPRQAEQTRRAARALEPRVSSLIVFHGPDTTSPRHLRSLQANLQGRPDWADADVLQTELPGLGFQEAARHQGVARRSAEQGSRVLHELKENAQRRSSRICWPERRWLIHWGS